MIWERLNSDTVQLGCVYLRIGFRFEKKSRQYYVTTPIAIVSAGRIGQRVKRHSLTLSADPSAEPFLTQYLLSLSLKMTSYAFLY